jgi:hypothetical protein
MIHTIYIDDNTPKGKELLDRLQKESDVVCFEKPVSNIIVNGYVHGSEFRASVKEGLVNKLKANGRL